nr:AraC family transcriptional regulator [uncultured Desulfobacter sp.]
MKKSNPIIISAQNYYGQCLSLNNFLEKKDGDEVFYNWSDRLNGLSKGFVYLLKCQPGLILAITRQYPSSAFSVSFKEKETNFVRLLFILGEGFHSQYASQEQKTTFCSNQGYLTFARNRMSVLHYPAKPFCFIVVLMEPWFVKHFSQRITGDFSRKIEEMLSLQTEGESFRCPVFMTPSIHVCIHEILGCTYIDARRHLFLGSKALELITLSFDQLNSDKGQDISCFNLETGSQNFVHKARDIMISDIKNPPSLTELSRMVGVNRNRLNECFRKVYGVTIFDFLRTFRLEESKRLLRAGNRSVTDVAFEVGYAQHGTFSREFKKHFGNTPSHYLG